MNPVANTNLIGQNTSSKTPRKEQVKSPLTSYEKYIDANSDAHLKEFMELIAIPSISSIPANKPDVESSIRKGQLLYCYYLQHVADQESKLKK